jgi:hypothetical protein
VAGRAGGTLPAVDRDGYARVARTAAGRVRAHQFGSTPKPRRAQHRSAVRRPVRPSWRPRRSTRRPRDHAQHSEKQGGVSRGNALHPVSAAGERGRDGQRTCPCPRGVPGSLGAGGDRLSPVRGLRFAGPSLGPPRTRVRQYRTPVRARARCFWECCSVRPRSWRVGE